MKEQAKRIRELEQNLEQTRGARKWDRKENRHWVRNRDDPHQYRAQRYDEGQSSWSDGRPQEKEPTNVREPRSEYSHRIENTEFRPSQVRSFDHQPRYHDDVDNDDEMPFSDYIMSVKLPRGLKPPTDMEPYNGSSDP